MKSQGSNIERDRLIEDGKKRKIGKIIKQNERFKF